MSKMVANPEAAEVALAALTKMVSLLAAELVVGQHNDDFEQLEAAVRAKLFAAVEGVSPEATAAGISLAHRLVNPVLRDLRLRVEAKAASQSHAAVESGSPNRGPIDPRKLH
jgi:hypothetical protein